MKFRAFCGIIIKIYISKGYSVINEYESNILRRGDLTMGKNKVTKIGEGKVRDIYDVGGGQLVIVTTDRISAYDVVLPNFIPDKGRVLNRISEFWFEATEGIILNHLITIYNSKMPKEFQTPEFEGRCMLVKKLNPLKIESIVRGYLTGSGLESYEKTGLVCGIKLPEGLRESEKIPTPIWTPTTKAEEGHDQHITFEQTVDIIGKELATEVRDKSIEIYSRCAEYAAKKGIIIADTKFEFGVDELGNLHLIDEVLTPDSSRFWPASQFEVGKPQESFDKQYVRKHLDDIGWDRKAPAPCLPEEVVDITRKKYIEAYECLTGKKF